jgi:alanyl-tRNA synthetase
VAVVERVIEEMAEAFPELEQRREHLLTATRQEEERFLETIGLGMTRIEELTRPLTVEELHAVETGDVPPPTIPGEDAFKLHDTYGFPVDLTELIARERGWHVDTAGYEVALEEQRARSRQDRKAAGHEVSADALAEGWERVAPDAAQAFVGYETLEVETEVVAYRREDERLALQLRENPFYAEAGGQVSDAGEVSGDGWRLAVDGVRRVAGAVAVLGQVEGDFPGPVAPLRVRASVPGPTRRDTQRNHTATHLLHAALRAELGEHVVQRGSLVAPERLRFDFAHNQPVTPEELKRIEEAVNQVILRDLPVRTEETSYREAVGRGAMALFGEKYGETVRVVSVPGFSTELCGGTHVRATGDIGLFTIVSEGGVAAGVRRIEAITGMEAAEWDRLHRDAFELLQAAIRADEGPPSLMGLRRAGGMADTRATEALRAVETIRDLHANTKRLARELQQARMKAAMGSGAAGGSSAEVIEVAGVKVVMREVAGLDKDGLRALVDEHRSRIESGVVILASPSDSKVTVVVGVTSDLTKRVPAGQVVRQIAPIVGGRGGGRPDFAEAGGKDPSKIGEMLAAARGVIETMLSAS